MHLSGKSAGPTPGQHSAGLSFAQERLWFLDEMQTKGSTQNYSFAIRLQGHLDLKILRRSLQEMIARHDVLRTTFKVVESEPVQFITDQLDWDLVIVDLSMRDEDEKSAALSQALADEVYLKFDLEYGPLFYAKLFKLEMSDHVLLFNAHAAIFDENSRTLFLRELITLYDGHRTNRNGILPDLPAQYVTFTEQERDAFQGSALDAQLQHWKKALSGASQTLELPLDQPRPPIQSYRGRTIAFVLNEELTRSINTLSERAGVRAGDVLLTGFVALIHRYTGLEDFLLGRRIANRALAETASLIGRFSNVLVLRAGLSRDLTFLDLLKELSQTSWETEENHNVPFELLVDQLETGRDLSRSPLVQVVFEDSDEDIALPRIEGVNVTPLAPVTAVAQFDFLLSIRSAGASMDGTITYAEDLFEPETISRFIGHLRTILESAATHPDHPISALPILTSAERDDLLERWNDTAMSYPQDQCIHQLIEEQTDRSPEAIAISFEGETLSYGELDRRANQLAHYLRNHGIGPDVLVGICLERSPQIYVAILGVLKAGGAYVPLDPGYPKDRLEFIVADSQSKVLIVEGRVADRVPTHEGSVIAIDTDWQNIAMESDARPCADMEPSNRAYVIFTSGSTGKPKGVQIEHRSAVNLFSTMKDRPGLAAEDIWLSSTPISFDMVIPELFLPLVVGARIELVSRAIAQDGSRLAEELARSNATVFQATPSTWRMLLEVEWPGSPGLKALCGGEATPRDLAERLLPKVASLWNMYGPTETTVWSTTHLVTDTSRHSIPIGRPLGNTQIYILDRCLNPVPVGVPGELHIGGNGVARGYLNRPELSEERFIPDPFGNNPADRIYKTGDLARYLPNGDIDFLGRMDNQVKVRGFRIELGEIEAVLAQHPRIRQNVAVVYQDTVGVGQLAAYIIPDGNAGLEPAELRAFLKKKLPDYMVPSLFIPMEIFPQTPSGKVDRNALPAPTSTQARTGEAGYTAPRTPTEETLAAIWAESLNIDRVGIRDNFFDLGGHSLLAIRMFSKIDKQFSRQVPLGTLFQAPTIEQLAQILDSHDDTWTPMVSIQESGTAPPFFCVGGGILHMRNLSQHLGADQPFYALQTETLEGEQLLEAQLDRIASSMVEEVRSVQPNGPYYLGGAYGSAMVSLEMARQLQAEGEEVAILVAFNTLPKRREHSTGRRIFNRLGTILRTSPARWSERLREIDWLHAKESVMSILWRIAYKYHKVIGRPMPRYLRTGHYAEMLVRRAASQYKPSEPFRGDATLYLTGHWWHLNADDPFRGWQDLIDRPPHAVQVPGDPCTMFTEPNVTVLGQRLKECLDDARKSRSKPVSSKSMADSPVA
ncbi:MAG: amino acid adenylation domain-containing protein [Hyphomicrobiales bacterium]|nr:amino acid adenylation domain-containing protein [Hyphomicrobiales bacterium]